MPNRVIRAEISGQECGTNYMAPVLNVSTSLVPPELGYNAAHTMVSVFSLFFCFVFFVFVLFDDDSDIFLFRLTDTVHRREERRKKNVLLYKHCCP